MVMVMQDDMMETISPGGTTSAMQNVGWSRLAQRTFACSAGCWKGMLLLLHEKKAMARTQMVAYKRELMALGAVDVARSSWRSGALVRPLAGRWRAGE